ncbi:MAG: right-handed parallel beta-helix repeat-containing protein [Holophagales bacterium]|nr:right-handed parallel beta-helix repeat-containing protein [Holophagales bacterium]
MRHALLLVFLLPGLAPAAGVVGNGTPGSCTEAALNAALSGGGIVTFSCGGSAVTIPITSTKTISAALATDVDGGGLVTLDGQDAVRIFSVDYQRQLALRNLTLRRGRAVDYGAGVRSAFHERGTQALTVANVRFEDNVCTQAGDDVGGGALYLLGGVSTVDAGTFLRNRGGNGGAVGYLGGDRTGPANGLTIRDSVFVGNETQARVSSFGATGGAIYVDGAGDGEVRIERCAFRDNAGWAGGAIHSVMYQSPQALVIVDSTFLENRATGGNGGAIYHQDGALNFTGSLVAGNGAYSQGGGLWLYHPTAATITNVTFTGNRAEGAVAPSGYAIGGAFSIYPSGPNVTLSHLTVTHNHAGWTGGGITVAAPASNVTIRASIVAYNTAANGGNPWNIGKNCDVGSPQMTNGGDVIEFPQRNLGDGNDENCVAVPVIADPRLGPLADHGGLVETVSLLPGSPGRGRGVRRLLVRGGRPGRGAARGGALRRGRVRGDRDGRPLLRREPLPRPRHAPRLRHARPRERDALLRRGRYVRRPGRRARPRRERHGRRPRRGRRPQALRRGERDARLPGPGAPDGADARLGRGRRPGRARAPQGPERLGAGDARHPRRLGLLPLRVFPPRPLRISPGPGNLPGAAA